MLGRVVENGTGNDDSVEIAELFADFREKRQQLRQLHRDGDPGAAQLRTQLEAMRPQVQAARKAMFERIAPILTPEQRQQIKEWRAQRRNRG